MLKSIRWVIALSFKLRTHDIIAALNHFRPLPPSLFVYANRRITCKINKGAFSCVKDKQLIILVQRGNSHSFHAYSEQQRHAHGAKNRPF